ncbi:hypothetical protein PHYBOEH_004051 [Phytophthora boehmeriae]|uniref:TAZ-type domain-containing protein n=1 Tax=Phytophthora boehmeriae TaxID=109152 RepID=A0A8T1XBR5_9STRA|nr:hypothetical protein PHYBOEH_004051 [Phytophthora boehmeriae]
MCDPRRAKKMCNGCMYRWHSRGVSREHLLTSRIGQAKSYLAWASMGKLPSLGDDNRTEFGAIAAPSSSSNGEQVQTASVTEIAVPAESVGDETAKRDESKNVPEETKQDEEVQDNDFNVEVEFGGVDMAVDEMKTTSTEERTKEPSQVAEASVETTPATATAAKGQQVASEANKELSAETQNQNTVAATETETQATPAVPIADTAAKPQTIPDATSQDKVTAVKEPQSTIASLEKLLRWFPTEDHALRGLLATHIEAALAIEDALVCARIGKCKESICSSTLKHYEHCKRDQVCADPNCGDIAIVYRHRRICQKKEKDAAASGDEKQFVCPFCIRIRQRRSLGAIAALDHLMNEQRRLLQDPNRAHSEASRNFCLQSISTSNQRKQLHCMEVERLNTLARESNVPIFNFPKYNWHFSDAVVIKREPAPEVTGNSTVTASSAPASTIDGANPGANSTVQLDAMELVEESLSTPDEVDTRNNPAGDDDEQYQNAQGGDELQGDVIGNLLRGQSENKPGNESAQQQFDKAMDLGYAIVDASFCAPSKAQRCLLNCQAILVHLQHHLDLKVCKQSMCTSVEYHFAHLSQCKARNGNSSCEYCLRVQEREFARAVDMMEADQPEAVARVQSIINAITTSFTNDPPEEREQTVLQLEDELDQAEDDKRELADKLQTAKDNLRKVRRSLESHGMTTAGSQRLPLHFIKVRPGEGSNGSSKKRRLLGSMESVD